MYFWAFEHSTFVATELAKQWWEFAHSKEEYREDEDPSCAVLRAEIQKPGDDYLDLTEGSIREQMIEWVHNHGCETRDDIACSVAYFIETVEKHAQRQFSLLKIFVPSPSRGKGCTGRRLSFITPTSPVYVVRHEKNELISELELIDYCEN